MNLSDIEVTPIDRMGSDLSVVNAARVSFHKESEWEMIQREITQGDIDENPYPESPIESIYTPVLSNGDQKLINYLAKHKHFSPFNHAFMSFRIKAPIFVARQLVKHKFMPWNEVSRRYVDEEPEFFFPQEWRFAAENVKQGSSTEGKFDPVLGKKECEDAVKLYRHILAIGYAPEQARMVLPQNMHTEWIWSGTLGAYADMLRLRLDPHTQYESRIVAEKIHATVKEWYPVSIKALLDN